MWPSPSSHRVGTPIEVISELNGWPACAPVNASPAMLPPPAHDSGLECFATAFPCGSFIRYSMPVLPGAFVMSPLSLRQRDELLVSHQRFGHRYLHHIAFGERLRRPEPYGRSRVLHRNGPYGATSLQPVTVSSGTSTSLSAQASGTSLFYEWSTLSTPAGARAPTFSVNDSATAGTTTATFRRRASTSLR